MSCEDATLAVPMVKVVAGGRGSPSLQELPVVGQFGVND